MNTDAVDAAMPLEPGEHKAQLAGLSELLAPGSRVIDIGAGLGRLAIPLAERGCDVMAIDTEEAWLAGTAQATADLPLPVRTRRVDALDPLADIGHPEGPVDAVLILGNTLALFHDTPACAELFTRLRACLGAQGTVYIDHMHSMVWREVREGYWQEGVSEEGDMQLVWAQDDSVVALRRGGDVDRENEMLCDRDTPMRLWSWGCLRLLARASGFSDPVAMPGRHLVAFSPV